MPQFDLANASISAQGLANLKAHEAFVPFVYDDGYPVLQDDGRHLYVDNDPVPSGTGIYTAHATFKGRVPYDPLFHKAIRGTLTVGYGHTFDGIPGKDDLYYQVYENGILIDGTTYTFPVSFSNNNALNGTGGFYINSSGTLIQNKNIRLAYNGNNSTNSTKRFSEALASSLLSVNKLPSYVNQVKATFQGYEDAFPYDAALAQKHFDMMCSVCYHRGVNGFDKSFFAHLYKEVDGTSVTSESDLTAYNNAAYALMFLALRGSFSNAYWDVGLINRRNDDIDELLGTGNTRTVAQNISPPTQPNWYQGAPILSNYFRAKPDYDQRNRFIPNGPGGGNQKPIINPGGTAPSLKTAPQLQNSTTNNTPAVDFWTGELSAAVNLADTPGIIYPDYYTGNRTIFETDPGDPLAYKQDPLFQQNYSQYWVPNEKWYHGSDVSSTIRSATKHGAVFASNPDGQTPAMILGLNHNGSGTSKVYLRSFLGQASISGSVDSGTYDIADGKSLGTIDYGQWNHFAISRQGNTFKTFKNGVKQDEWQSTKSIARNTRDGTLKFSIGRSQGADYFHGFIDDFRITKGTAVYTADFTPPSAALTTTSTTGLYNGDHYVESALSAVERVCQQLDVEFRVNNDATLDAGKAEVLFAGHGTNEPTAIIARNSNGEDPGISGLNPDSITSQFEAEDYVSGVEYLVNNSANSQNSDLAEAFDASNPYRDLFGNELERVQFVSEPNMPSISRQTRAEAFLNELKKIKKSLSLSLEDYDIQGDFKVGDMIYVYDPEIRFVDTDEKRIEDGRTSLYEVAYRGEIINPEKIRITGITWPIKDGYGVYLRRLANTNPYRIEYIDLTEYVSWESGNTSLDIGDLQKRIGDDLRFTAPTVGVVSGNRQYEPLRPKHPTTGVTGDIQLVSTSMIDALGVNQSLIKVTWDEPNYDNGTPIQNGLHYLIRYKPTNSTGDYSYVTINWAENDFTIEGLQLATTYDVGVAAVLSNGNYSPYATGTITTAVDTTAPEKPGPADTIAAGAMRVQIIHSLGRAEDELGNPNSSISDFTLSADIDHLNVYASTSSGFSLSTSNLKSQYKVGELPATASHIRDSIPVVGEIQMPNGSTHYFRFSAVDIAGNESDPSDEQSASGNLVATANISDAAITEAKINSLAVTTAKISDAAITNAKISNIIQSDNYVQGTSGWIIKKTDATYTDGFIEISDAVIRGNITATTGAIGGWTIASNKLSAGNLELDAGNTEITGNYTAGSQGFKLANDGSVEFNSGTFRGDLVAGTIDIGSNAFQVDSQGRLFMGASTFGGANFSVDANGTMVASGATIAGTMTINAGSIHIG